MPRFAYQALSADGETVNGEMLADTEVSALDQLARRGLIPVLLSHGAGTGPWWQREVTLFSPSGRLTPVELERVFSTLAALLRARLPLPRALAFCEEQSRDRRSRNALSAARMAVENGKTLSQGLRDAGEAFPGRLIALVASGEASNRLEFVANRTALALLAEAKISREIRGALVYPIILLVMAALVMAMITFFLAPTLLPVFASAGTPAPLALRVLAGLGDVLTAFWPIVAIGSVALLLMLRALRSYVQASLGVLALRLPVVGGHLRRVETLRICQSMSLMLGSGTPLLGAVNAAKETVRQPAYAALLQQAEIQLTAGGTLCAVFAPSGLIDPMAMALLTAGEEADRLPETLQTASETLESQVTAGIAQAIRLLTPILTLIIGASVAGIILTTISAMMDLNDIAF